MADAKVLILVPDLFASQTKFDRKVSSILADMAEFDLLLVNDKKGLVEKFATGHERIGEIQKLSSSQALEAATHAIVFDDGEEFPEETRRLDARSIPLRIVRVAITRVINVDREANVPASRSTRDYEYIGRGTRWGNTHAAYPDQASVDELEIRPEEFRDEAVRKFQYDFERDLIPRFSKEDLAALAGKRLGCHCKPWRCHGDVLAEYLNAWDDGG